MLLSEVKDIPWLFSELARPSLQDQNTQEVPGNVDRQDYSQGQEGNHCHEQDDVALEGQICHGINATFTSDLLIPATEQRRCILRICKFQVLPRSVINMRIFSMWQWFHTGRTWIKMGLTASTSSWVKNFGTTTLVSESVVTRSGRFRKPSVIK